jgi:orotate phosphoribosyltransferase
LNTEGAERVLELAHEVGAFLTGEFTLTSGKKSNFYFDGKRITLHPEGAYHIGKVLFDQLA